MKPNLRCEFSEPFASQLRRALQGYSPDKKEIYVKRAMKNKPPSLKQLEFLKTLGVTIVPNTMAEASKLIEQAKSAGE